MRSPSHITPFSSPPSEQNFPQSNQPNDTLSLRTQPSGSLPQSHESGPRPRHISTDRPLGQHYEGLTACPRAPCVDPTGAYIHTYIRRGTRVEVSKCRSRVVGGTNYGMVYIHVCLCVDSPIGYVARWATAVRYVIYICICFTYILDIHTGQGYVPTPRTPLA